jgi:hypothetical protein
VYWGEQQHRHSHPQLLGRMVASKASFCSRLTLPSSPACPALHLRPPQQICAATPISKATNQSPRIVPHLPVQPVERAQAQVALCTNISVMPLVLTMYVLQPPHLPVQPIECAQAQVALAQHVSHAVVALKQPVNNADDGLCASTSRCVRGAVAATAAASTLSILGVMWKLGGRH